MKEIKTFGSLCSGIEAASFVFEPLGIKPIWFSEIAEFPSKFLSEKYPNVLNVGDMNEIPQMVDDDRIEIPDLICGGTPCQAFSLAGWRNGINDDRGQLTLKYIDIINAIDKKRLTQGQDRAVFFWENVEGALTDKTNAFGCFLAGLLDLEEPINVKKWSSSGVVFGKYRNIAWRVMDAKYFGVPQQRKRIYLLGGGKCFHPEQILFEEGNLLKDPYKPMPKDTNLSLFDNFDSETSTPQFELKKEIEGHEIEAFRSYSDCLYAAYGTKWNGNAAALNGSLFFAQDGRLRRFSPLECERLMGFPDDYTRMETCTDTQRYQAIGNSWAVPVIKWIANRLFSEHKYNSSIALENPTMKRNDFSLFLLEDFNLINGKHLNASKIPYNFILSNLVDIADTNTPEKFYITPKGCAGILRRKQEHNFGMNTRLEIVLQNCSK